MSELAGLPAWYWQVLGVLGGLALGVLLGAVRMRRRAPEPGAEPVPASPASARQGMGGGAAVGSSAPAGQPGNTRIGSPAPDADRLPRVMIPTPTTTSNKTAPPATSGAAKAAPPAEAVATGSPPRRSSKSASKTNGSASSSHAAGNTRSVAGAPPESPTPAPTSAAQNGQPPRAPSPSVAPAGPIATPAAPALPASAQARQPAAAARPVASQPQANPAEEPPPPAAPPPAPDAVAVLQEYTTELLEQLRTTQSSHTQELQVRNQQVQEERRRHEALLESLRQEHSAELTRLMGTMAEQVDLLHQQYGQRIKQLESDVERLRLLGNSTVSPADLPAETVRAAAPAVASAPFSSASAP